MAGFFSLLSVENTKLWKRISTKLMVLILVVVVAGMCALLKFSMSVSSNVTVTSGDGTTVSETDSTGKDAGVAGASAGDVSTDWKQQLKDQNEAMQENISQLEKSGSFSQKGQIDSTKKMIAENNYRIEHNLKPEAPEKNQIYSMYDDFWSVPMGFGAWQFVALFAVIACSALVAGEFSESTMKSMITRPFARWQILTAKFITLFLYTLLLTVVAYGVLVASTAIFFGTDGIGDSKFLWMGGGVHYLSGFAASLVTLGLDFLTTLVFLIFTFALCAVSRSRALSTGLGIFLMFGGSMVTLLASRFSWGKLIFFADTNFSGFVVSGAPFYGITLGLALLICAIYCAVFFFGGYFTFAKRDIS